MIPAWTVSIAAFLALLAKYYGYDLPEVIHHRARARKTRITEKEWMLVLKFLGIQKEVEPFVHSVRISRNLGYIVFVVLGLVFLLFSFLTPYLYALGFSLLSGIMFFLCVRMFLGPKRTWKLTVRHDHYDVDRYLIPWSELKK